MGFIDDLLGGLPPLLVYLVVGAIVVAESAFVAGVVLPAATSLVVLGLLANAGAVHPVAALVVAIVAACLGGTLGYLMGRHGGSRARNTRVGRWIGEARWNRAGRLFDRHGGRAVFVGVWVAGARTLAPRLAGMNSLPYRRFARWHIPAAVSWATWLVGASYLAGASYQKLASQAGHAGAAIIAVVALIAAVALAGRRLARHSGPRHRRHRVAADTAFGAGLLILVAAALVAVVPTIVRFSGLRAADAAVARWAGGDRTSISRDAAWAIANSIDPGALLTIAVAVLLARWWWTNRRQPLRPPYDETLVRSVVPVLLLAVLGQAFDTVFAPIGDARAAAWNGLPLSGLLPAPEVIHRLSGDAAETIAVLVRGETAELAAAAGLLVWLLAGRLRWPWQVTAWTAMTAGVALCAGSWVYLGLSRTSETVTAALVGVAWAALNIAIVANLPGGHRRTMRSTAAP